MTRPDFLKPGDSIAIVSPSYHLDDALMDRAVEAVRAMGFNPVLAPNARNRWMNCYSGKENERLSDLEWAYRNQDIKAILASRGGYGAIQLIRQLDSSYLRNSPKWLIGYSDISCLHAYSVCNRIQSIHGIMGSFIADENADRESIELTRELLLGQLPRYEWETEFSGISACAEGILVGGNLATLTPLAGTRFDPFFADDIILFIEEVGESAHNIDRMLRTLELHGVFTRVRGIVCGAFTDCGDEYGSGSVEKLLCSTLFRDEGSPLFGSGQIPTAYSFPAGHGGRNFPLIEGGRYRLSVQNNRASLELI